VRSPSIRQIVEFGLDSIPEDKTIEVSLRDLLYVHQVLGELNRFFHQPEHYKEIQSVAKFLGTVESGGGYQVLHEAYYTKLRTMLPPEVERVIEEGAFDHPDPPSYYDPAA
jgi:hypothetical protein